MLNNMLLSTLFVLDIIIIAFVKDPFWKITLVTVDTLYLILFLLTFGGVTLKSLGVKLEFDGSSMWGLVFPAKYLY